MQHLTVEQANEAVYAWDRQNSLMLPSNLLPTTPGAPTSPGEDAFPLTNWTLMRSGTVATLASKGTGLKGALSGPFYQLKRTPTWQEMLQFKTIGWLGSLSLMSNNIIGPGLVTVPLLYQWAGWITPTLAFIFYAILATLGGLFTVEAMQSIPGNRRFKGIVEFSTLVSFYFGRKTQYAFQIILFMALQATNIASIIISAQTFDNLVIAIFHKTCGVCVNAPDQPGVSWYCVTQVSQSNSPFGDTWTIISIGLMITMVIIIPLGLLRIADNIWVQTVSLFVTLMIFISWLVCFGQVGLNPALVPAWGSGQSQVIGTVLFNFAFVTTVPSWINVKSPRVSIQRSMWTSSIYATILYVLVGMLGGMAFDLPANGNILTAINASPLANIWTQITAYLFPIATLLTSIPIFVIVVYQNLIQNEICKRPMGIFLSGILPFLIVIPFQSGSGLQVFVNWSSLLFTSTANFILPLVVYLKSLRFSKGWKERHGGILTAHQRQLLLLIHPSSRSMSTFLQAYQPPDQDVIDRILEQREEEFAREEEMMRMAVLAHEAHLHDDTKLATPLSIPSDKPSDKSDDYFGKGPWTDSEGGEGSSPVAKVDSEAVETPTDTIKSSPILQASSPPIDWRKSQSLDRFVRRDSRGKLKKRETRLRLDMGSVYKEEERSPPIPTFPVIQPPTPTGTTPPSTETPSNSIQVTNPPSQQSIQPEEPAIVVTQDTSQLPVIQIDDSDILPAPLPMIDANASFHSMPATPIGHQLSISLDKKGTFGPMVQTPGVLTPTVNNVQPDSYPNGAVPLTATGLANLVPIQRMDSNLSLGGTPTLRRSTLVRALSTLARVPPRERTVSAEEPFSRIGDDYDPLDPYDDPFEPALAEEVEQELGPLTPSTPVRRKTFWQKEVEDAKKFHELGGSLFGLQKKRERSPSPSPGPSLQPTPRASIDLEQFDDVRAPEIREVRFPPEIRVENATGDRTPSPAVEEPIVTVPIIEDEKFVPKWQFWNQPNPPKWMFWRKNVEEEITFQSSRFKTLPKWVPISSEKVAWICLVILTASVLVNLIWTIIDLAEGNSPE